MKNILIHGLGQNHKSWNETIKFLEIDNIDVLCPALFKMSSGNSNDYQNIFSSFSYFCNNQEGKLNLCEQNRYAMACQGCGATFFFSIIK